MVEYKKIWVAVLVIVFFVISIPSIAMAGGAEYVTQQPVYSGLYFEGNAGGLIRNWATNEPTQNYINLFQGGGPPFGAFNHGKGGFVGGLVLGYQWNEYFSAEFGWVRFVTTSYYVPTGFIVGAGSRAKFRTWLGYLALKLDAPFFADNLFVFGKIGAAEMTNRVKFDFITAQGVPGKGDYWAPMFAFGFQYYINWNWSVNFQYMFVPGYPTIPIDGILREAPTPSSNLLTLGLGYKLAI